MNVLVFFINQFEKVLITLNMEKTKEHDKPLVTMIVPVSGD